MSHNNLQLIKLPPLSLYIHFPWCIKKCPYCDFNSHEMRDLSLEKIYLEALHRDLQSALPLIAGREIISIFIGGGTPSLLSTNGLDRLLRDIRNFLPLAQNVEITMESNPGTFEADKFQAYRESGINRLSIGIQSFNDTHLAILGRIHNSHQAHKAIEIAHLNFKNFNLDMMYALPQQTIKEAYDDFCMAVKYKPTHLSFYHLTLEPNTFFAKYPPILPNEDISADIQNMITSQTAAAGYIHYEVSAYAKNQQWKTRHNLNYWKFGDYLGIGAGAHSKLSFKHHILRQVRYKNPSMYLKKIYHDGQAISKQIRVNQKARCFEFMLNALRLKFGFPISLFAERTGVSISVIDTILTKAKKNGLLYQDHKIICPTKLGYRFLNNLQEMFLSE